MKRRIILATGLLLGLSLTACQDPETGLKEGLETSFKQALEETFAEAPGKLDTGEETEDKDFFEKLGDKFWDKESQGIFSMEIMRDVEAKLGFELSIHFNKHFMDYLEENNIERYLSEEEILAIGKLIEEENYLLNNGLLKQRIGELVEDLGTGEIYLYRGGLSVSSESIELDIIDPANPANVDIYRYYRGEEGWESIPHKSLGDEPPMEKAIRLDDIDLENIAKMVDTAMEVYRDMGDYKVFDNTETFHGLDHLSGNIDGMGKCYFSSRLWGTREDRGLTFDIDGNLIEERSY